MPGPKRGEKREKQYKEIITNIKKNSLYANRKSLEQVSKTLDEMTPYLDINAPKMIPRETLKKICEEYTHALSAMEDYWSGKHEVARQKISDYKHYVKLRRIMSKDIHTFERLLLDENKNEFDLVEAMEQSRSVTITIDEKNKEKALGGVASNRIHIKNDNVDGYFTVHDKPYDIDEKLGEVKDTYGGDNEIAKQFLDYLLRPDKEGSFTSLVGMQFEEKNAEVWHSDTAATSMKYNSMKDYEDDYSENLEMDIDNFLESNNLEKGTKEYDEYRAVCESFAKGRGFDKLINSIDAIRSYQLTYATRLNGHGINKNSRMDMRNSAMSAVAEMLGIGDVVAPSRSMRIKVGDQIIKGTFMETAKGEDILRQSPDSPMMKAGAECLEDSSKLIESIANLQILDFLCGNPDRHLKNFTYIFNKNHTRLVGIQGIDNDLCFGTFYKGEKYKNSFSTPLSESMIIPEKTADAIMNLSPETLRAILVGYDLDYNEIAVAADRLLTLKANIEKSREHSRYESEFKAESGYVKVLNSEEIDKLSFNADLTPDDEKTRKEFTLFHRVKNVFANKNVDNLVNENRILIKNNSIPHFHELRRSLEELDESYKALATYISGEGKGVISEDKRQELDTLMKGLSETPIQFYDKENLISKSFEELHKKTAPVAADFENVIKDLKLPEDKAALFTNMKNTLSRVSNELDYLSNAAKKDREYYAKIEDRVKMNEKDAEKLKKDAVKRSGSNVVRPLSYKIMNQSLIYEKGQALKDLENAVPSKEKKAPAAGAKAHDFDTLIKFPVESPKSYKEVHLKLIDITNRDIYVRLGIDSHLINSGENDKDKGRLSKEERTSFIEMTLANKILYSLIDETPKLGDLLGRDMDTVQKLRDDLISTMRKDKKWQDAIKEQDELLLKYDKARESIEDPDSIKTFNLMMKNGEGREGDRKLWLEKYFSSKLADIIKGKFTDVTTKTIEAGEEKIDLKEDILKDIEAPADDQDLKIIKQDEKKADISKDENDINIEADNENKAPAPEKEVRFATGAIIYGQVLSDMKEQLSILRNTLSTKGLRSPDNSYEKDREKSSKSYKKMADCLDEAILAFENAEANDPLIIKQKLSDLYKASLNYYNDHIGVFGPRRDFGKARIGVSDILSDKIPAMINCYDNLRRGVCFLSDENGIAYGNKTFGEIAVKKDAVMKDMDKETIKSVKINSDSLICKDKMKVAEAQIKLKQKLRKISKTMLRNYEFTKPIDQYLGIKTNMSFEDKAKYYLMKEVLDGAYKTDVQSSTVEQITKDFNASEFKRQVKALANNVAFRNCVRDHKENAFSEWKKSLANPANLNAQNKGPVNTL